MGSSSSKPQEIVKYIESDESKKMKALYQLENQLKELQDEVSKEKQLILNDIEETVIDENNVLILRYSNLQNMDEIQQNVRQIFGNVPLLNVLVDTATQLVSTMNNTKELTELMKWQQKTIKKRIDNKVYGMEIHYKLKVLDETTGRILQGRNTMLLIAYKCKAYVLKTPLESVPDDVELKKITF
ncbi:unnamed protein product [Rotaria sp. Silwood1]|nr:unnamed protein product [Rotaria sp. Silwood1]CAF1629497.1 unnamed protein product [Rotaria sp. Silwood1]CAF3751704.1 unnamed protein product [Rotaria sp. Silwood1]CAF3803478.1 unnamed protein product [Rotaria sp. Silwood1]CAF3856599.1 unnamed protein product [Rotaria sp. Silwood1]